MGKITSKKGLDSIEFMEGFKTYAYKCSAGVWTIGVGHTKGVKEGDKATPEQIEKWLSEDLKETERYVNHYHPSSLNQDQFDSLVSFVFNIGIGTYLKSSIYKQVKANPSNVFIRNEFMKYIYAGKKKVKGLEIRRKRESDLYFGLI